MIGTRVQIPAYTDRWMMGDRFGEIIRVTKGRVPVRDSLLTTSPKRYRGGIEMAHVRLDKSGKVVRVILDDCRVV